MQEFCKTCPDFRDEGCQQPNRVQGVVNGLRLVGNALASLGGGMYGGSTLVENPKLKDQETRIAICISEHQEALSHNTAE